eukprot:224818_1
MAEEVDELSSLGYWSAIIVGILSSAVVHDSYKWLNLDNWRKKMECIECILHYIMGKHRISCAICKGSGNVARAKWSKNFQAENECQTNLISCYVCSGKGTIYYNTACVHCAQTPCDMLRTRAYAEIWVLDILCVISGAFIVFGWHYYGSKWIDCVSLLPFFENAYGDYRGY